MCFFCPFCILVALLGEWMGLFFVLVVHLFVGCARVNLCHVLLPPGVRGWLRLLLVALPGLFCLPFCVLTVSYNSDAFRFHAYVVTFRMEPRHDKMCLQDQQTIQCGAMAPFTKPIRSGPNTYHIMVRTKFWFLNGAQSGIWSFCKDHGPIKFGTVPNLDM